MAAVTPVHAPPTHIIDTRNMEKRDLRIVFMGTPEFAVGSLKRLVEGGCNVVAVVSQPDRPVGRHASLLRAPAVKEYAQSVGLPVLQPERMKDETFISQLRGFHADLQVVVAYRMLPEIVWSMPRFGTFNVHASLLPQYRGAAPINWAVINGETETGITTFFLDREIDTGRVIMQRPFAIPDDANAEYVHDGLMSLGAELCLKTVELVAETNGDVPSKAQPSADNLHPAPKIFRDTCRIDWTLTAKRIYDFIRGLSPYPGAWTTISDREGNVAELKIVSACLTHEHSDSPAGTLRADRNRLFAAADDEWLEIKELQIVGKRRLRASDFLNGFKDIDSFVAG